MTEGLHTGFYGKALLLAVLSHAFYGYAGVKESTPADTLQLHEVSVSATQAPLGMQLKGDGVISLSRKGLMQGVHFFGESDALKSLTMVPGFSNSSDYSSGISVDGSSYSQTAITLDGAPIFFPYHFGGIFSTFNTGHIAAADADRFGTGLTGPARIGGWINVRTSDRVADGITGTANVGILASSASIALPFSRRVQLSLSARRSYINALYGRFLTQEENGLIYGLTDLNATLLWLPAAGWTLKGNFFMSSDDMTYRNSNYVVDTDLKWHNTVGAFSAKYAGDELEMEHGAGWSGFRNEMRLNVTQFVVVVPSGVEQLWAQGSFSLPQRSWEFGYRGEYSRFKPQYANAVGTIAVDHREKVIESWLALASAQKRWRIGSRSEFSASARVTAIGSGRDRYLYIDPRLQYTYRSNGHSLSFNAGSATQNMHQVGFSDFGLSTNFWLPAVGNLRPERSIGVSAAYGYEGWRTVQPSATLFYKRVLHEAEYTGDVLGLMSADYYAPDFTRTVNGFNAGGDFMVRCEFGRWSGWVGYNLTFSRRRFPGVDGYQPSTFEPLNSLKVMAQWSATSRLKLSAYFNYSSGRPYTPISCFYIFAGNVIAEYGPHNSGRLPAYHRLDLSMTYRFNPLKISGREVANFLNVSLLNAYGHKNIEMRHYTMERGSEGFALINSESLYRFIPSISYTIEF